MNDQMAATRSKINTGPIIQWAISIILPIIIFMIPVTAIFTETLRLYLTVTVFCVCLMAFNFFPMMVSGLIMLILYMVTGLSTPAEAFSPWTNVAVQMVLVSLLLGNIMDELGLLKRISYVCIAKAGGTFKGTLLGYYLAGIVLNFLTFNNGYIIVIMLAPGIIDAFNLKKHTKEAAIVMIVAFIAACSSHQFSYTPMAYGMIENGFKLATGNDVTLPWYTYTVNNWPYFITNMATIFLLIKIFKPNVLLANGKQYFNDQLDALGPITTKEKKCLVLVGFLLLYLLTSTFHKLPIFYGFFIVACLMYVPGIDIGTESACKNINVSALVFNTTCMAIGIIGMSCGIGDFMITIFTPILSDLPTVAVILMVFVLGFVANILMSPSAMLSILPAMLITIALSMNINPMALISTMALTADSIIFPHETVVALIVFGYGMISMKDFIKMMSIRTIITVVILLVIQVPYWGLIGVL